MNLAARGNIARLWKTILEEYADGMNNHNNTNPSASGSQPNGDKKPAIESLPRMEMYAVLGLELGKRIFEKLVEVEKSIDILACQKLRELNPDTPESKEKTR